MKKVVVALFSADGKFLDGQTVEDFEALAQEYFRPFEPHFEAVKVPLPDDCSEELLKKTMKLNASCLLCINPSARRSGLRMVGKVRNTADEFSMPLDLATWNIETFERRCVEEGIAIDNEEDLEESPFDSFASQVKATSQRTGIYNCTPWACMEIPTFMPPADACRGIGILMRTIYL